MLGSICRGAQRAGAVAGRVRQGQAAVHRLAAGLAAEYRASRAQEAFGRAIFPAGHPNRPHTVEEYLRGGALRRARARSRRFHAKYIGPNHMTLVLAGDVDDRGGAAARSPRTSPAGAAVRITCAPREPAIAAEARASPSTVPLKDKPSTSVIIGQPTGLRYRDPDALPLRVGTAILGQGFTGRLMGTVRDREGLTYGIGAGVAADSIADGDWSISATFAPALLEQRHRHRHAGCSSSGGATASPTPSSQRASRGSSAATCVGLSTDRRTRRA